MAWVKRITYYKDRSKKEKKNKVIWKTKNTTSSAKRSIDETILKIQYLRRSRWSRKRNILDKTYIMVKSEIIK